MGAPDSFILPGSYNDGYKAMGDAVAMPVAQFIGERFLIIKAQFKLLFAMSSSAIARGINGIVTIQFDLMSFRDQPCP